jgi:endoglucanase Acf2
VTGIPNTSNEAALESLCDQHANAVIVQAQGTLLPDGTYSFQYLSTDLTGVPTALPPLVLLKAHHVNSLLPLQSVPDTGLSLMCLTGPVEIYAGSTFVFQPKAPRSLDPAPNLPNGGAPLTQAQAQALCAANGPLAQAIAYILANYGPTYTVYTGGKVDYQIALTLHYGVKALQIAGLPLTTIMPLYERLRQRMAGRPPFYQYETQYGGIIAAGDDYGNHSDYNDHIVQYGYDVMSFSILKVFEDANFPQSQGLLGQTIPLTGYGALTYAQMVDLIAADMGELSRTNPYLPVMRNLDVYIGHSWLSGLGEKNTESQSEVVLGSWATAYWLSVSGAPQDQLGTALTRFALETESLNTYNYIGTPANSVFNTIAPAFTSSHNVVSITWGNGKLGDETYWGLNWDRIFACEFMPASANTMDTMLDNVPVFAQNGADYILANWSNFDTGNTIQSVLIPIVSKVYGATQGAALIANVAAENNFFDNGTNAFILSYINYYADNQLHQ